MGDGANAFLHFFAERTEAVAVDDLVTRVVHDLDLAPRTCINPLADHDARFAAEEAFHKTVRNHASVLRLDILGQMPLVRPAVLEARPVPEFHVGDTINGLIVHDAPKALARGQRAAKGFGAGDHGAVCGGHGIPFNCAED